MNRPDNAMIYERALEDVVRLLHQQGRTEIGQSEWQELIEARLAVLGWKAHGPKAA